MADFRKWFIVLAVIACMAGVASAQVGIATPNGSTSAELVCSANGAGVPFLRPEGFTELVGDIVITCTGGPAYTVGTVVPTTNITVFTVPTVPITSRLLSASNGASEALLTIDEPGSGEATGATGSYGPNAPQVGCTLTAEFGGPTGSCGAVVALDGSGKYEVAVSPGTTTNAPNVFQGQIGGFGNSNQTNSVTFYNVPVLPPATAGVSRVFRITNVRVPVPGYLSTTPLQVFISTSPSTVLPLVQSTIAVGVVGPQLQVGTGKVTTFQQCVPQGPNSNTVALSTTLSYTEGFATAFKTRVVPGGNTLNIAGTVPGQYAAEQPNTGNPPQNIPGGLYGGFSQNSESGLIFPSFTGTSNGLTATAGLADYGTRLKALFYNLPAGVSLYVSANSVNGTPSVIGGFSTTPYAVLVATSSSAEATPDSFGTGGTFGIAGNTNKNGAILSSTGVPVVQLTAQSNNTYEAVWEVTNSNPSAIDNLQFGVYIAYSPTSPTTTNPYGTPITGLPPAGTTNAEPVNEVQMSFAPEPSSGAFTTANGTQGQWPTPRFTVLNSTLYPYLTINLCQTTLLYPFITGANGFTTGIAIANTSADPFGTVNQSGSCKLWEYGVTVGATGNTAFTGNLPGCDQISNPLPQTNCFPIVPAGQVMTVDAMTTMANFQGYVIAVCNFQYAHGYAAITDVGVRNIFSSYLALELAPLQTITCSSGSCTLGGGVGSPRAGVQSIEELVH